MVPNALFLLIPVFAQLAAPSGTPPRTGAVTPPPQVANVANAANERAVVPLSIDEVLRAVTQLDPTLRANAFERLRAEVDLRRARWNRVSGTVGVDVRETVGGIGLAPTESLPDGSTGRVTTLSANALFNFRLPLYAGGAIQNGIASAEGRLEAARHDRRRLEHDLKRAALVAYAQVIASSQQIEVVRRALDRAEDLVSIATRRRQSGIASEAEIARAQLNRLRQQEDFETRLGDHALAMAFLRATLLITDESEFAPSDTLESMAAIAQRGAQPRPELQVLESRIRAQQADRKVAFAGYLPRLELFASGAYGNGVFGTVGDVGNPGTPVTNPTASSTTPYVGVLPLSGMLFGGVRLSWTGWDFFITRDNVARAEAQIGLTGAQLDDTRRVVRRESEEARARETQARRRVEALRGGAETSADAIRLARARYETGNTILTEVLDAELEGIGIEARQVQARLDLAVAHIDRLRAEGHEL